MLAHLTKLFSPWVSMAQVLKLKTNLYMASAWGKIFATPKSNLQSHRSLSWPN